MINIHIWSLLHLDPVLNNEKWKPSFHLRLEKTIYYLGSLDQNNRVRMSKFFSKDLCENRKYDSSQMFLFLRSCSKKLQGTKKIKLGNHKHFFFSGLIKTINWLCAGLATRNNLIYCFPIIKLLRSFSPCFVWFLSLTWIYFTKIDFPQSSLFFSQ